MDYGVLEVIIAFLVVIVCYLAIYSWAVGSWHPIRNIKLRWMKHRVRHCNNCRYFGYNNECYAYRPQIKKKYNYTTGEYYNVPDGVGIMQVEKVIGTRHCNWEPISKK